MINSIKLRLTTESVSDELLLDYINDTTEQVLELLNMDTLPKKAESIVKDLVIIKYNKTGSEGLTSESYSGVAQQFEEDIPSDIKRRINRLRKLPRV